MFRGVHQINMDEKGRLAMPARLREPLLSRCAGRLVATIDPHSRRLFIYPLPDWEQLERDVQEQTDINTATRRFLRLLIGYAADLELDGSGRLLLPPPLREHAALEKKLVLVGQGKKLELWAEKQWKAELDRALEEAGPDTDLPPELMSLAL